MRIERFTKSWKKFSEKKEKKKGLSAKKVDNYLSFMLFLTLVGMIYIWNSHYALKQVREMETLRTEVKELKSQYLMRESTLQAGVRISTLSEKVDSLGLKKLNQPAFKIIKTHEPGKK